MPWWFNDEQLICFAKDTLVQNIIVTNLKDIP